MRFFFLILAILAVPNNLLAEDADSSKPKPVQYGAVGHREVTKVNGVPVQEIETSETYPVNRPESVWMVNAQNRAEIARIARSAQANGRCIDVTSVRNQVRLTTYDCNPWASNGYGYGAGYAGDGYGSAGYYPSSGVTPDYFQGVAPTDNARWASSAFPYLEEARNAAEGAEKSALQSAYQAGLAAAHASDAIDRADHMDDQFNSWQVKEIEQDGNISTATNLAHDGVVLGHQALGLADKALDRADSAHRRIDECPGCQEQPEKEILPEPQKAEPERSTAPGEEVELVIPPELERQLSCDEEDVLMDHCREGE